MISDQGVRGATFPEKPHLPPWNSANAKARRAARTTSNGLLPIDACLSGVAKWCFEQITNSFVKVFFSGSKKGHNAFSSNRWLATTTFPTYQNRRKQEMISEISKEWGGKYCRITFTRQKTLENWDARPRRICFKGNFLIEVIKIISFGVLWLRSHRQNWSVSEGLLFHIVFSKRKKLRFSMSFLG